MSESDREALADLVTSPGWLLFKAHAEEKWGAAGFAAQLASTLGNPDMDANLALQQLRQATVAQKAVLELLDWPKERYQQLHRLALAHAGGETPSRRGPGL